MRIFDCFMFYDEEVVLDIRLNSLKNSVDCFVIVESKFYHNGKKRDLKFDINKYPKFKDKIIYIPSSFRSNSNNAFKIYPRKNHRYKLGREALIETSLLSKCDGLIYVTSNIASAAIAWNLNKSQKQFKIDNGINSKNLILSNFLWFIRGMLPELLGGFKKTL